MKLIGAYTALITPFNSDLSVDYAGLEKLIEFQISNGISGLVALGTTGETPTLTKEEQVEIIKFVVKTAKNRVPVIVGTGTNATATTIANTQLAKDLGADAALVVAPYYNKPTQEGLYLHFEAITKAVQLPVIVYNIKGRSAVNIETVTMQRIARLDSIIGVKEASGDINQIADVIELIQNVKSNFSVVSGDDGMTYPIMALGGRGTIAVCSNIIPRETTELVQLCLQNKLIQARDLHFKYSNLFKTLFLETNPAPVKSALKLMGLPAGSVRLPLAPTSSSTFDKLTECLENYKLLNSNLKIAAN